MWVRSAKTGKVAPVDAAMSFGGNVIIDYVAETYEVVKPTKFRRYRLHFVVCPDAVAFRKEQKRRKPKPGQLPFEVP